MDDAKIDSLIYEAEKYASVYQTPMDWGRDVLRHAFRLAIEHGYIVPTCNAEPTHPERNTK